MGNKISIGIIGVGNMGTAHIKNIIDGKCPEFTVAAVADINPARLDAAKELAPEAALFDDAIKMLDSGRITAAIIAVPHYFHPALAIACMERGIHVMVEKPAGVYTKQVREMNAAAEKSDVVFGMMFNQRTNHIYRKMKEIVDSGELGNMRRVSWIITDWYRPQAYFASAAWRATWSGEGGGALLNQCPHQLDLLQWICGLPVKVDAKLHFGKWRDIEVEDDVTAYMEFPNGATGTFITSTSETPGSNRFELTFDGGKLIAENNELIMWKLAQTEQEFSAVNTEPFGTPDTEIIKVETDGKSEQHAGVLNAFGGAILRGEPLIAGGEEGIRGLTLSNAMHLSTWLDKAIEIPFDEDLYFDELMKRVKTSRLKTDICEATADTEGTY